MFLELVDCGRCPGCRLHERAKEQLAVIDAALLLEAQLLEMAPGWFEQLDAIVRMRTQKHTDVWRTIGGSTLCEQPEAVVVG